MFPKRKTCDECGRPFQAASPNQKTCTPCLLKPHRKEIDDIPGEDAGTNTGPCAADNHGFKVKTCEVCKKPYSPTGPAQKKCPECGGKKQQKTPVLTTKEAPEEQSTEEVKAVTPTLQGLNVRLFEQVERLSGAGMSGQRLRDEIERGRALAGIAQSIIGNSRLMLDAAMAVKIHGIEKTLPMIEAVPENG